MAGVKIPISPELDPGDLNKALEQLKAQINGLGATIATANKVKFNPIDKAAVDDLKRVAVGMESLRKVSTEFRRRLRATGQEGAGFFDVDWAKLYPDAAARARSQRNAFEYVTGRTFVVPPTGPAVPPGRPGAPRPAPPPPPSPGPGAVVGGALRQGLGGALNAAGPVGSAVNKGLSSGFGGFLGGMLALGAGQLVGGVRAKVGDAEQEALGYDTLKRSLGDVNVGFGMLRESLRGASDIIDVTFADVQRLGMQYAQLSGMRRGDARSLAEEVSITGGFGRSFGLEPSFANGFFARMRGVGVGAGTDDTRRLAVLIGETIARAGGFSRAAEIMEAVAGFAIGQTRSSLTAANIDPYTARLAGMLSSGLPGMDPTGASGLLSRVNSSIAGGGAAGRAGQAFLYSAIGSRLGLDPIQTRLMWEQGAFGSGQQAFGASSPYSLFARKYGLKTPGAASSAATNLQLIMEQMQRVYGRNPELMADAMSNLFGLNISQSMALASIPSASLGKTQGLLAHAGVNLSDLSATGISALSTIATGSRQDLLGMAGDLNMRTGKEALTDAERELLDGAVKGDDVERLREVLIKLYATREQQETEGSRVRESINDLDKTLQKFAHDLLEPTMVMRNALVMIAGNGKMGARGLAEAAHKADLDEENGRFSDAATDMQRRIEQKRAQADALRQIGAQGGLGSSAPMQDELDEHAKQAADLDAQADALQKRLDALTQEHQNNVNQIDGSYSAGNGLSLSGNDAYEKMRATLADTDRQFFPDHPGTAAAVIEAESTFRPLTPNAAGHFGYAQLGPDEVAEAEKIAGHPLDQYNPEDAALSQRIMFQIKRDRLRKLLGREPTQDEVIAAYHAGEKGNFNTPEMNGYIGNVHGLSEHFGADATAGKSAGGQTPRVQVNLSGTFTIRDPNTGVPRAATDVQKTVTAPLPYGITR